MKKKVLVFVLMVVMTISYIPTAAFAVEGDSENAPDQQLQTVSAEATDDVDNTGEPEASDDSEEPDDSVEPDDPTEPEDPVEPEDPHFKVYPYKSSTAVLLTPSVNDYFYITKGEKLLPYRGKDCVSNSTARSLIDYQLMYYRENAWFKGRGECWGYAEYIRNFMGGGGKAKYYNYKYSKANKKKIKRILKKVRAGTHVRVAMKKNGGGGSHSMVLFKFTEDEVLWAENNSGGTYNRVHYYIGTADDFVNRCFGWKYFVFVHQPGSYKKQASLKKIYAYADPCKGSVDVIWPAVKGVKQYTVYRSYKKSSGYKKIAVTNTAGYSDKAVTPGKKAYYKIKAKKMSNVVSATRKIKTPIVTEQFLKSGKTKISWQKVPGATCYKIYTATFSKGDYKAKKLVKKVTDTSWIPAITRKDGDYVIRAISSESGGSSKYFYFYLEHGPEQVKLNAVDNGDYIHISFSPKTSRSDKFILFRSTSKTGSYTKYKTFEYGDTCAVNIAKRTDGKHYFFKMYSTMTYFDEVTWKDKTLKSGWSNSVETW